MRRNTELSRRLILKATLLWAPILALSQVAFGHQEVLNGVIPEYESSSESLVIDAAFIVDARSCSAVGPRNTPSMRFHSALISKLFTAIVIMQLRDEGLLSLEDRLKLHLPEFQNSDIRLSQLLTRTSGLNGRDRSKNRTTQEQVNDYIKSVSRQRIREPGSR
jgi:hypothetical protein